MINESFTIGLSCIYQKTQNNSGLKKTEVICLMGKNFEGKEDRAEVVASDQRFGLFLSFPQF